MNIRKYSPALLAVSAAAAGLVAGVAITGGASAAPAEPQHPAAHQSASHHVTQRLRHDEMDLWLLVNHHPAAVRRFLGDRPDYRALKRVVDDEIHRLLGTV